MYFTEKAAEAAVTGLDLDPDDITDRPLAEGNVKFTVVADGDDNITDEWGNELEDNVTMNVTISTDETAPTVTKITVEEQNEIRVYFSEAVEVEDDNFTIVDEDGDDVDVDNVTYDAEDDYATLTFDTDLEGQYSMTIEDVVDLSLEENEIVKVTMKFEVEDENAPSLDAADVTVIGVEGEDAGDDDYIYVTFEEDMATSGAYSVLNKDNYQIKVGSSYFDLGADDRIVTSGGNDRIKITLDNEEGTNYNVENASIYLVIGRVADALGNKVENFNAAYVVDNEVSPIITAVKTLSEKLIKITINGELKSVNKAYINVSDGVATADLYSIKTWELDGGKTIITGVLPSALALNNSADKNIAVTLEANRFETVSGTEVAGYTFAPAGVTDGYAPSVDEDLDEYIVKSLASGDNGIFTITFDENLKTATAVASLYAQDLVVKNSDGDILVAGVDYTTTAAGKVITVTITDPLDTDTEAGNYKVYSTATIKYIQDVAGNEANAFTDSVTLDDLVVQP
jgi:hypothetical protein